MNRIAVIFDSSQPDFPNWTDILNTPGHEALMGQLILYAVIFGTIMTVIVLLLQKHVFGKIFGFFGDFVLGSLYGGNRRNKDHKAILKGMYQQATGLRANDQNVQAEKVYRQILADYPEELDARYLLAELLYVKFDKPKPALRLIKELQKKVKEKDGPYQYSAAMNDLSLEIQDYLAGQGPEQKE